MAFCLLAFLHDDPLAGVTHTLALVGLGRPVAADLGGDLAHFLAVDAFDDDLGLARRLDRDAFRYRVAERVRESQGQIQVLALHRRTVADADQLELALEALGHAGDHIREIRPRRAGRRDPRRRVLGGRNGDHELLFVLRDRDAALQTHRQRALGALDGHGVSRERRIDALRQIDRQLCNSGHDPGSSGHQAQHFAALAGAARLAVGHDAGRRRDDCDAEPAHHLRQLILGAVLPQAGP
jgi:hypothetical protein